MKRRDPSVRPPVPDPQDPAWEPLPLSLARWTGHALYWATDLAGRLYAAAMADIGLAPPHVAVLQILADEGPMNQNRLARRTRVDKAPLVGHLNALQAQGLVERRAHPTDRRAFEVHLTPAGHAKLAEAERVNADVTDRFFAPLAPDERRTLHDLLTRLASSSPPGDDHAHHPDRPTDP